ncbi:cytochrome P450 [Russula vinacea]|nr:cytochrome P450 [Russula vinacea]
MYLNVLGKPTIVFNGLKSAFDMLERRASNSSGRPRNVVANGILFGGLGMASLDHGEAWRRMRRASHEALTKVAVQRYHPLQTKEATILRAATSTIMSVLYDYPTLASAEDKAVQDMDRTSHWVARTTAWFFIVEFFPWIMHIPQRFLKWKREALKHAAGRSEMFLRLFNRVKTDLINVGVRPSFSASLIEHRDRYRLSEREMAFLAGQMYSAGFETTSTTLLWWRLRWWPSPRYSTKRKPNLMPSSAVRVSLHLPTLRAFLTCGQLSEKFFAGGPLSRSESLTQRKRRLVRGHVHSKRRDMHTQHMALQSRPDVFGDDVDEFRPERHLGEDGELLPGPKETNQEGHVSFGFGRRTEWKEIPPDTSPFEMQGFVSRPSPYDCIITSRFPEVQSILVEEHEGFED